MPVEVWPTTTFNGKECWVVEGFTLIEKDPYGDIYYLVRTPDGGVGAVGPLVKGDPGKHTEIDTTVPVDTLAPGESVTAEFVEITPGSDTVSQVVQLQLGIPAGEDGDPGPTIIVPDDYDGTAAVGNMLVVDAAGTGFELKPQGVGGRYFPASLNNTPSGNATYTLGAVSIAAQSRDWRPEVMAACEVTGTGTDVKVDLVARLGIDGDTGAEAGGNEVGRAFGSAGQYPPVHVMIPGPDAGSANDIDLVPAGSTAVVYLRAERQSGADYFTTLATRTRFWVKVNFLP